MPRTRQRCRPQRRTLRRAGPHPQHDHGQWQTQTGGPTDPQAGNIPGGRRDTLRGADFNDGTLQGFATDSGAFTVQNGLLKVTATGWDRRRRGLVLGRLQVRLLRARRRRSRWTRPSGGWKANAYIIFDYFAPNDFKFAGVDESINKMVIGHRNASGWWYDAQASVPGSVSAGKFYNLNVVVNGLVVTVTSTARTPSATSSRRATWTATPWP